MTKHKFSIYHTPRNPMLRYQDDVGVVVPFAVCGSRPNAGHRSREAHISRRGVKYPAVEGARMFLPREVKPPIEGFPLRFATRDGMQYVQRNGVRYRLDKLVSPARVPVQKL